MSFPAVCRTCLSTVDLLPINSYFSEYEEYSSVLYSIADVKVSPNDDMPQKICKKCDRILTITLQFRQKCKNSESQLLIYKYRKQVDQKTGLEENQNDEEIKDDVLSEEKDLRLGDDDDCDNISEIKEEALYIDNDEKLTDDVGESKEEEVTTPLYVQIDDKKCMCLFCEKHLNWRSIEAHLAKYHPNEQTRKSKCEVCHAFVLKRNMDKHMMAVHDYDMGKCSCCYCKTVFPSLELLSKHSAACKEKHKRKYTAAGREMVECNICNKKMQRSSVKAHIAIKHSGLGPVCEHCGRRFSNKFRLTEHYRAKHGYDKFKCADCDFQSASSLAMRNHERRHRGEKPFICESCGAKFHAAYLLAQHKQSHRTEKLLKCDQCSSSFKTNNSLHMHKINCHSLSLYKCSMCDKTYNCRHYVVKHMRHFHEYRGAVGDLEKVKRAAIESDEK